MAGRSPRNPDLHEQLEDLRVAVWEAERAWEFDDRLDLLRSPGQHHTCVLPEAVEESKQFWACRVCGQGWSHDCGQGWRPGSS